MTRPILIASASAAGTGIGEAIAHKFAFEGARVLLAGLPGGPVDDVAGTIRGRGGLAETYCGDLSEELHAQECVTMAVEAFGKLDILDQQRRRVSRNRRMSGSLCRRLRLHRPQ